MEYLESDASRVWPARTKVAMKVWLAYPAAVFNLKDNGVAPCSTSRTGARLLMEGRGVAAQTRHTDLAVRDEESPGYCFTVTNKARAHL